MKKIHAMSTFAQKYNLEGRGKRIKISQKTKDTIDSLNRQSSSVIEKGKEYSKQESRGFGGCPKPGEVGSEKYFSAI